MWFFLTFFIFRVPFEYDFIINIKYIDIIAEHYRFLVFHVITNNLTSTICFYNNSALVYVFSSILLVLENCNFRSLKSLWILSFQFAMNPVQYSWFYHKNSVLLLIVCFSSIRYFYAFDYNGVDPPSSRSRWSWSRSLKSCMVSLSLNVSWSH